MDDLHHNYSWIFFTIGIVFLAIGLARLSAATFGIIKVREDFRAILDQTLDSIFIFAADSLQYRYVNEGAVRQVGYTRDELLSMHAYDIEPDYSESALRDLVAPLVRGGQSSMVFESVHQHKSGQRLPVEISLQYMAPKDQPPHFIAIVRDIADRKAAEAALRDRESFVRAILDTAVYGIVTIDATGIDTVIIGGVDIHVCCEATAREARHHNRRVIFLADGTATRDQPDAGWGTITADKMQCNVLTRMALGYAEVTTIEDVIGRLETERK